MVLTHHTAANHARQFALLDQLCGQRDTDALTGLVTRRAAEEQIRQLLDFGGEPFAMLMCDVDNFKHINDTYATRRGTSPCKTWPLCCKDARAPPIWSPGWAAMNFC